jgi:hypothetical protein
MAMNNYLFTGIVLPERAHLSFKLAALPLTHFSSGFSAVAMVSVASNQIAICIKTEHDWDIFDLRNLVKYIISSHIAMIGYLKGYVYDAEITRVICEQAGIDYVFPIDIPCLAKRQEAIVLQEAFPQLQAKVFGPRGMFVNRCLADLSSAMRNADDTGFYCYRAVESLRHHCASTHNLKGEGKVNQWTKFRQVAGCDESVVREIQRAAEAVRHGELVPITSSERADLLMKTWKIVEDYLNHI